MALQIVCTCIKARLFAGIKRFRVVAKSRTGTNFTAVPVLFIIRRCTNFSANNRVQYDATSYSSITLKLEVLLFVTTLLWACLLHKNRWFVLQGNFHRKPRLFSRASFFHRNKKPML